MSEEELFREVDEDVQRARYKQLWQRYGRYVVIAVFVILGAAVAFVWWQNFQQSRRAAFSDQFAQATRLADEGRYGEAVDAFADLADAAGGGYSVLARLRHAALLVDEGDVSGATELYDGIANDRGVDGVYRDLAVVLSALNNLDFGDAAELTGRLEPLTEDGNPWRYSARELIGLLAIRDGDDARAREIFQDLADDLTAPQGLRARAAELLAALGQ